MKARSIEKIVREKLLGGLPGFQVKGKLVHRQPLSSVLQGFYFDDSEFSPNLVYVWTFVLPLYVPRQHLAFTFGRRLINRKGIFRSSDSWFLDSPPDQNELASLSKALSSEGIPFLQKLSTPENLIDNLRASTGLRANIFVEQAIAFSYAKTGQLDKARKALVAVSRKVAPEDGWQHVKESSEALLIAIDGGEAKERLAGWTLEVSTALALQPPDVE